MTNHPNVLIEDWLPFEELGIESQRERAASSALPPLYFLHVWWARKPLTVSRASILAGILPNWDADWANELRELFPTKESYQQWIMEFLGIKGDPIAGKKTIEWAKRTGATLQGSPYDSPRAFTVNPIQSDLEVFRRLLESTWGTQEVKFIDVTSGGGSIPFEALRYGLTTFANELNPVASVILKATLEYPSRFGQPLTEDIKYWGQKWISRVDERLSQFFPIHQNESVFAYLWARSIPCPTTGKPVPLSPNWWLDKQMNLAVQIVVKPEWATPRFVIGSPNESIEFGPGEYTLIGDPNKGTVSRGVGVSPWTNEIIVTLPRFNGQEKCQRRPAICSN